jgi:hypothetical protein
MRETIAAEGITPLEYLLSVMRDDKADLTRRIDAAKAAAPYVHARLSAVELSGSVATTHEQFIEQLEG